MTYANPPFLACTSFGFPPTSCIVAYTSIYLHDVVISSMRLNRIWRVWTDKEPCSTDLLTFVPRTYPTTRRPDLPAGLVKFLIISGSRLLKLPRRGTLPCYG